MTAVEGKDNAAELSPADRELCPDARALREPLQRFVRALWSQPPVLRYTDQMPFIAGGVIHLPASRHAGKPEAAWQWYRAAAAHSAAHLAFSPTVFDARGLPPVSRALLGLLEDARVEALACREMPGLRALWASLHVVEPQAGDGFEGLLLRLSRALVDPAYRDPHPWVRKGLELFFADAAQQVLALRRPEELRTAASMLGHYIGQMRLAFDPNLYVPGPDYRDDQRWMWPAQQNPEPDPVHFPDWDRLIERLRRNGRPPHPRKIE